jgi:hypothetical protein
LGERPVLQILGGNEQRRDENDAQRDQGNDCNNKYNAS